MWRAWLPMQYDGELNGLVQALEKLYARISLDHLGQQPDDLNFIYNLKWAYHSQGRFHEAAALLETVPDETDFFPGMRDADIGWAFRDAGDLHRAQHWFESALLKVENVDLSKDAPWSSSLAWPVRAFALAGLGRSDEAARLAREALSRNPRSMDEIDWWLTTVQAAYLFVQIGDNGSAIELIQQLLDPPSVILPYELWFGWGLAPLRTHSEFRELMVRHGVVVTRDPIAEYAARQTAAGESH
jgi:tetratricopeptide (TPR) repeat protein